MTEILSRRERKARKAQRCVTCNGDIEPGESYIRVVLVNGSRVYEEKQHIHCEALAIRYCRDAGKNEYDAGEVNKWAQEEVCSECDKRDGACADAALTCPLVLEGLLPPTMLTHEDVRRHLKEKGAKE